MMPSGPTTKTDLTMRLQGQSGENINVRVFERGGEIQVAVRSSDPAVANIIRHELPGLQNNLEHAGWQMGNVNTSGQSQQDRESEGSRQQDQQREQAGSQQNQQRRKSREDEFFELSL
jgi:flagellar hook-length control protein FliK